MRLLPLLTALLIVQGGATLGDDGVEFHGVLQMRATATQNVPGTSVLFDPSTGEMTHSQYLRTTGGQEYLSGLASLGLEGHHLSGRLHWALTVDTGELQQERPNVATQICWSRITPSGLAVPGSGQCGHYPIARVLVPVLDTQRGGSQTFSNGRSLSDEAEKTWLLREAYASYSLGRADFFTAEIGRRRTSVGDGYVYDDYATGVELHADVGAIGPQWDLSAGIFDPSRDFPSTADEISPVIAVRADYLPSLFGHAGLFLAGMRERNGTLGNLLHSAIDERLVLAAEQNASGTVIHRRAEQLLASSDASPYESDSTVGWLGTSGTLTPWKGHRLSWTASVEGGEIHQVTAALRSSPVVIAQELHLQGELASLRWESELARRLSAGLSLLYLSGGQMPQVGISATDAVTPASGTYRGFIGISPYITETNLFFDGGLSETFADRQTTAPGVNGRGVLASIVNVRLEPTADAVLRAKAAFLRAPVPGPFGGQNYGTEFDLEASFSVLRWLILGAEADALFPGDFFRGRRPLTKGVLALDVVTP